MPTHILPPDDLPASASLGEVETAVRRLLALARRTVRIGGEIGGTIDRPVVSRAAIRGWHSLFMHTDANVATANKDGAAATPSMRTLGTGSAQAVAGNDTRLARIVPVVAAPGVGPAWLLMPLAVTEFLGGASARFAMDATGFTQFRVIVNVATAGAAAAVLRLRYFDGASWTNAQSGGTGGDVSIAATGLTLGTWVTLIAGARQERQFTLYGLGGDGVANPAFDSIQVQFRVP